MVLQVIQRNVTWNIIHIIIHERKDLIRGMAAKSSNELIQLFINMNPYFNTVQVYQLLGIKKNTLELIVSCST